MPGPSRTHKLVISAATCHLCANPRTACQCTTPQPHAQAPEAEEDYLPLSILRLHASARPIEAEEDYLPLSILRRREP
jgi:hypothetical protein